MATELQDDDEIIIYETPQYIEVHDLSFEEGEKITNTYPEISLNYEKEPGEVFTDNLAALGCHGLVINEKIRQKIKELDINNLQYFDLKLIEKNTKKETIDYKIANIIGAVNCLDYDNCDLVLSSTGSILFIEKLAFIDLDEDKLPEIFRLGEFLPLIVVNDRIKQEFEAEGFTGFVFYRPEDYS
ncbi:hypothetical protein H0A36_28640 [Endozoicomonas sp. SM1973]|uniref:Immunity MXAN-0049 protein domain-containing protein n=2 Tax=Spartinivicinus marinus TaxID=2994442 RepID=A0A853IQ02_9GAMM|nr:DUF1629 domain-containing protein [Spartinivicinus marinus]NYZ69986.1 hypothetical protein [Spartinivicinus marinus]